jgi:hypothetical protein
MSNLPKSIWKSKTIQGGLITLLSSLTLIGVNCAYENRFPDKNEAVTIIGFVVAFAWTLVGRNQTAPIYTPDGLPGANKSDFIKGK